MKLNLRWQLLLATLAFSLIFSLLSFQVQTAGLCTTRVPASGGTFTEGIVGAPLYLNPLLSDGRPVDQELVSLLFDGLIEYNEQGEPSPALAQSWNISQDGRSLQFRLRPDATWHDGQPVTANDVAFTYSLMQDPAFPGSPSLHTLWQSVAINIIDPQTIEFTLSQPYAPFLEATTRGILPAHLLQGTTAANLITASFNRGPIGTGPFMVDGSQNWQRTGLLRLLPNPAYWRQGTKISAIAFRFYPDTSSLVEALATGEIQAANRVSAEIIPAIAALPQVRLFSATDSRTTTLLFNLSQTATPAITDLTIRQALAYGLNQETLIDDVLNGQGLPLRGPYLPQSWAYNPDLFGFYSYQPITATRLLESAGWTLPSEGTIRRQNETPLTLRLLTLAEPTLESLAQHISQQWQTLGIGTQIITTPDITTLRQTLTNGDFDIALVHITPSQDPDLYDFWSQEAIIRGQNYAGWNNRRASEALETARQIWPAAERRPYYQTFLRLYQRDLPALTLYQHVYTYALGPDVNEAEIGQINHPRDRYETLANWFMLYRDTTIACPLPQE